MTRVTIQNLMEYGRISNGYSFMYNEKVFLPDGPDPIYPYNEGGVWYKREEKNKKWRESGTLYGDTNRWRKSVLDTLMMPFDMIPDFHYKSVEDALSIVNGEEIQHILSMDGLDFNFNMDHPYYLMTYGIKNTKGYFIEIRNSKTDEIEGYMFHGKDSIIIVMKDTYETHVSVFKKKDDKYYPFVSGSYGTFVKDGVAYQYPVFQKKGGMEYIYTYDKKDLLIKECRKMVNGHLESENLAKVFQRRYLGGTIETESNYPILFKLVSGIVSDSYVLSTGNYSEMIEKIKIRKNKEDEFDRIENCLSIVINAKEEN